MAAKFQNGVKTLFYKFQCKGVAMQKQNSGALKKKIKLLIGLVYVKI